MDVELRKGSVSKGRGLGRGGLRVGPDRRLADDGKRLDSLSPCWTFHINAGGSIPTHYHIFISLSIGGESEGGRIVRDWAWQGGWRISVLGVFAVQGPPNPLDRCRKV